MLQVKYFCLISCSGSILKSACYAAASKQFHFLTSFPFFFFYNSHINVHCGADNMDGDTYAEDLLVTL